VELLGADVATNSVQSVYLAIINVQLGENDEAFRWLDHCYEQHCVEMIWRNVADALDPLRGDPRYDGLMRKVGIPFNERPKPPLVGDLTRRTTGSRPSGPRRSHVRIARTAHSRK